jgi:hypothetical protein
VLELAEVFGRCQMLAHATLFNPLEPNRQPSKKECKHEVLQFRKCGATARLGLPLALVYVGTNVMANSHSRRRVRHTSARPHKQPIGVAMCRCTHVVRVLTSVRFHFKDWLHFAVIDNPVNATKAFCGVMDRQRGLEWR